MIVYRYSTHSPDGVAAWPSKIGEHIIVDVNSCGMQSRQTLPQFFRKHRVVAIPAWDWKPQNDRNTPVFVPLSGSPWCFPSCGPVGSERMDDQLVYTSVIDS